MGRLAECVHSLCSLIEVMVKPCDASPSNVCRYVLTYMLLVVLIAEDMYPSSDHKEGDKEPDWVNTEREQFGQYRDKVSMPRPLVTVSTHLFILAGPV